MAIAFVELCKPALLGKPFTTREEEKWRGGVAGACRPFHGPFGLCFRCACHCCGLQQIIPPALDKLERENVLVGRAPDFVEFR